MKIKMLIPVALVLCLAFSLCACDTTVNTNETTTAPAETTVAVNTEATTTVAVTTAPVHTNVDTETDSATEVAFTEDDALELVKNTYDFSDDYYFMSAGLVEIEGTDYYAVDLRKSINDTTTYLSSYFVTTDGSEIKKGYTAGGVSYLGGSEDVTVEISEDNAVAYVYANYDFEDGCFLVYKGTEEIDGTTYFVVDLMKSLESNTTYLSSYFVTENGVIVTGYYAGDNPVLAE